MPRLVRIALLDRMKLRAKLSLAFLCLSVLIGLCGASGVVFIYRIGATLTVFADITSPLLGQTVVLADNAQRMRGVFLDAMSQTENVGFMDASEKLNELSVAAGQRMEKMRQLLDAANLPVHINEIRKLQNDL